MHPCNMSASDLKKIMSLEDPQSSSPWMNKELLQKWLQTYYKNINVTGCEVMTVDPKGDSYMSLLHRVTVKTKDGDNIYLVIKCRLLEGRAADILKDIGIHRREKEMYEHTLPRLSAILQEALPESFEPVSPICYYTCKNFLVLEDLNEAGFKMLDRRQGLDLNHCLLVVCTLAKFHAASVILHQQDPESVKKFGDSVFNVPHAQKAWNKFAKGMIHTLIAEMETWPGKWKSYVQKLREFSHVVMKRLQEITRCRDSDFNVLLHGDMWVTNMLFRDETHSVRFVDYQLSLYSSPALDLQFFLTSTPTLEVMVEHRDHILQEYHNTLQDTLNIMGYTGTPTLEEFRQELNKKSTQGLWTMIGPLAVFQSEPGCGFDFEKALEDGSNPGPSMLTENYKEIVKKLLPIFDMNGAFDYDS